MGANFAACPLYIKTITGYVEDDAKHSYNQHLIEIPIGYRLSSKVAALLSNLRADRAESIGAEPIKRFSLSTFQL